MSIHCITCRNRMLPTIPDGEYRAWYCFQCRTTTSNCVHREPGTTFISSILRPPFVPKVRDEHIRKAG